MSSKQIVFIHFNNIAFLLIANVRTLSKCRFSLREKIRENKG